jgi:hypothetical protein
VDGHADVIDALTQDAIRTLRRDVATILVQLRRYLAEVLARAKMESGRLADDAFNVELATKLGNEYAGILRTLGWEKALGEVLDAFSALAQANDIGVRGKLGRSFSSANLRSLSRVATGSIDRIMLRGEEAGAKLREVLVIAGHTNATISKTLDELAKVAGVTLRQAIVEAETQLMAFARDGLAVESAEAGIDLFFYDGPDDGIIRPFCADLVGKIVTLQDLDDMDNGENQPKPVSRFLGGYRCRHGLDPLSLVDALELVERRGRLAIAPGATLARKILLQGYEGPAEKAFRVSLGKARRKAA